MAGIVPGRPTPEQGPLLPGRASGSGLRRRGPERSGHAKRPQPRLRGGFPISPVVVRHVGRGPRRRPSARRPRKTRLRTEPTQRPVLACPPRESLRQVSVVAISNVSTYVLELTELSRVG